MPVLEIADLTKQFVAPDGSITRVLDVPQFSLGDGEQVALEGASGSGKTTLLHVIAGILQADGGSVSIGGRQMLSLTEPKRDWLRASSIGYVFQTFNLLQGYTALENVLLAMAFGRGIDASLARSLLKRVGLADRMAYRPRQLSVGQQQRVAVARALANRPRLVLADEPTGNLDARHASEVLELIRSICREHHAALLLVSHDREMLKRFDRVVPLAQLNRALAPAVKEPQR